MRFLSAAIGMMVFVCTSFAHRSVADEKPTDVKLPDGAALMRTEIGKRTWITKAKSLRIKGVTGIDKSLPGLLKAQRDVQRQFNPGENPDLMDFRELIPSREQEFEYEFDQRRIRETTITRTQPQIVLSRDIRLWDGKRATIYSNDPHHKMESFLFDSKPDDAGSFIFSSTTYLRIMTPAVWWRDRPEFWKQLNSLFGAPEDFVSVGTDEFHGVECHVLLSSRGNQSDRYYFGVQDGRWYGAKEGIMAVTDEGGKTREYRAALEEFLGRKDFEVNINNPEYFKIYLSLFSLPQDQKERWCRIKYPHVKKYYPPVFEYWFSDFRDLGEGRSLPFSETRLHYTHEKNGVGQEEVFLESTSHVTIQEVVINEPIREDLLESPPLQVGAKILDRTHKPPVYYDFKERFTDDEWKIILRKGKELEEEEEKDRQRGKRGVLAAPER